jgi:1,4-dihydroxy-2-naphthoate octaprenyltransferase
LAWLSAPAAWALVRFVNRTSGRPLNRALAGTGQLTLFFGLLYAAGLLLGL